MAAYTQVSSQALNRATRLNHVVDPLGRVKGVPANWNYIVVRSEVKTREQDFTLASLSLSQGAGRSQEQHCQKARCFP